MQLLQLFSILMVLEYKMLSSDLDTTTQIYIYHQLDFDNQYKIE